MSEQKLGKLENSVAEIIKKLDRLTTLLDGDPNLKNGISTTVYNHENRIKRLEDWQIKVIAIYTVLAFLLSFVSPIIYNWLKST